MGIRLKGQTSGYVEIKAPATAADNTLTFPNGNGSNGQILTTDGSGNLSFSNPADTDKITEGNTEAEVVDSGSDGHFKVTTEGSERVRVGPAGQIGIGGANYGSTGQVLTSTGGSSAASWSNVEISSDTSPQLGGHLDVNGNDIVTTSNGDIDLDPNGSGQVVFKGNATRGSGAVKLNCENNSHGILVKGPPHSAGANYTLTLPNDTGTSGQLLSTNGSGVTSWSTVNASPSFEATADGALTDGMPVIIQADGTVRSAASAVTQHTVTNASEVNVHNQRISVPALAYIEDIERIAFATEQTESSLDNNYIQSILNVTGDTLSVTTPAGLVSGVAEDCEVAYHAASTKRTITTFRNGNNDIQVSACDASTTGFANHMAATDVITGTMKGHRLFATTGGAFVVAYDSSKIYVRGFTNDGSSFTFGTQVEISAVVDTAEEAAVAPLSVASNGTDEALIIFADNSDSDAGKGIPVSLSGTAVTLGSIVEFESSNTGIFRQSVSYDEAADKYLIAYSDKSDGGDGHLINASINSSNVLSFGTVNEFTTTECKNFAVAYDPIGQKHLVVLLDNSTNKYNARKATISGDNVTVDSKVDMGTGSVAAHFPAIAYHKAAERFVTVYEPSSNVKGVVTKTATQLKKLTSENYIGISNGAYADGATATIQLVGSVDDAQSGLTPGQSYFVKHAGGIALTADEPSVVAGTAVSATKLIVKG